nr:putative ribonuclease H-like domain-containing protein [Tanacetum cinerariifolium]
ACFFFFLKKLVEQKGAGSPRSPTVSLTVETKIPTVSSPVPTICLDISPDSSSYPRIISKGDYSQKETPTLGNALTLSNRFEDTFGEEADLSNMETSVPEEPTKIFDALKDPSWVEAMQEELLQFKIQNVWILVDCPKGMRPIGTKWVLKNKKDKKGIVIRNKARLVAQGYTQEQGIEFEEVFAPAARIEAIRLFLAYASFMGFTVYQMDVKGSFLYGTIDEEVYVMQPPGFQDPEFPDRVYKVEKAMYGLHQAPRAWYGTLFKYLLDNGFQRGTIDQTLFIRKHKREFLLVQVYVDDIIFGLLNPQLCREFEALMHDKFQISAIAELTFFLSLQVLQKKDGIFLSQDKYVGDILKKFGYSDDNDYGGATQDRKSTIGGCQFLGRRLISWQCKKQTIVATSTTEAEYVAAASGCGQVLWIQNQMLDYGEVPVLSCDYWNA